MVHGTDLQTALVNANWVVWLAELATIVVLGVGMTALVRARKALPAFSRPVMATAEQLYRAGKISFAEYQNRTMTVQQ